jgi:hypothetical protein
VLIGRLGSAPAKFCIEDELVHASRNVLLVDLEPVHAQAQTLGKRRRIDKTGRPVVRRLRLQVGVAAVDGKTSDLLSKTG